MFCLFLMCSATAEKVASKSMMLYMLVCKQFCWGDAAGAGTCSCSGVDVGGSGGGMSGGGATATGGSVGRKEFCSTARGWCLDYRIAYVMLWKRLLQFG